MIKQLQKIGQRLFQKSTDSICLINLPRGIDNLYVPLGLLSVASCLKKASLPVRLLDFDLLSNLGELRCDDTFFDKAVDKAVRTKSKLFGITADCSNYPVVIRFTQLLKQAIPDGLIILGGPHASFVAAQTLEAFPEIDIVVIGEAEVTAIELVLALKKGADLQTVNGIAYRSAGGVVLTPPRPLMENLDDLPYTAFDLFPMALYLKLTRETESNPMLPIEAGRGCPKKCYYCATSRMWRRDNRLKSPERIYREMAANAKRFGVTTFGLLHDNLAANRKFLAELCRFLIDKGSPYTWSASASTDRLSRDTIQQMKKAGCRFLFLGIESASPRIQKIMGKRLQLKHADDIVKACLDVGLDVTAAFILGFPEETEDDLELTLNKILAYRQLGVEGRFMQLSPLPGTPLYRSYFNQIRLHEASSMVSPEVIEFPGQRDLIGQYPEIFSSFYTIPNSHYPDVDLSNAISFFDIAMSYYSQAFVNILDATEAVDDGPVDVYRHWQRWKHEYCPDGQINPEFVFYSFNDFLDVYSQDFYRRIESLNA
jgi:radical SAM superfamily enzyme YgiQ (UPF0313 family)